MAQRPLTGYRVSWWGPPRHESLKKAQGLDVLSIYIAKEFRQAKVFPDPAIQYVHICFRDDVMGPKVLKRTEKTNCLWWARDYHALDALSATASNEEVGEFSIKVTLDLMDHLANHPDLISNFPLQAVHRAIQAFRAKGYSYTSPLGKIRKFDASPLSARFFLQGNCLETTSTMIFYLGRQELHRREVIKFGAGRFEAARYSTLFDLYDETVKVTSIDMTRPPPHIPYRDLPENVRQHLPTNEQLQAEWRAKGYIKDQGV